MDVDRTSEQQPLLLLLLLLRLGRLGIEVKEEDEEEEEGLWYCANIGLMDEWYIIDDAADDAASADWLWGG